MFLFVWGFCLFHFTTSNATTPPSSYPTQHPASRRPDAHRGWRTGRCSCPRRRHSSQSRIVPPSHSGPLSSHVCQMATHTCRPGESKKCFTKTTQLYYWLSHWMFFTAFRKTLSKRLQFLDKISIQIFFAGGLIKGLLALCSGKLDMFKCSPHPVP